MDGQTALVAQGHSLVRLENDTQIQIAVQHPRDESKILTASLKELDLYPSMAKEALYTKPVGKDDAGQMKYAEGLSIRTAESLANRWTNSSYGVVIEEDDPEKDYAIISGVFLDYENNIRHIVQRRVSRFYKSRGGQIIKYAPDRFNIVIAAENSKLLREVLLRSLPAGLKKEYENRVRQILNQDSATSIRTALLERLEAIGVSVEAVEKFKGKSIKAMKKNELTELVGLANAVRDGEIKKEEAFGMANGDAPKEEKATKASTVKAEKKAEQQPLDLDRAWCVEKAEKCDFVDNRAGELFCNHEKNAGNKCIH